MTQQEIDHAVAAATGESVSKRACTAQSVVSKTSLDAILGAAGDELVQLVKVALLEVLEIATGTGKGSADIAG